MSKRMVVSALALSILTTGSAALRAQTCGGTLSCTSTPAYTFTSSAAGPVLLGTNTTNTSSPAVGVQGKEANGTIGSSGVAGFDGFGCSASSQGLGPAGVIGGSAALTGVIGFTNAQANGQAGVAGYYWDNLFTGCGGSAAVAGYLGYKTGNANYGVYSSGNLGIAGNLTATGTKSFVEPHPTDASKEIRYVSLEGPEAGTYFRGSGHTVRGRAIIEVPESFRMVTAETGLTVVVTPTGGLAQIAAISKSLDRIVIESSKDVAFDYMVNGARKGFQNFRDIVPNSNFVPTGPDDRRFFSLPAESRQRLIDTGIYLPDGTVNLEKAHEMGWDRNWKSSQDARLSAEGFLRFAGLDGAK